MNVTNVTKKLVMLLLVFGMFFLATPGAWALEMLYAPFEDYYLVLPGLLPNTTVNVANNSPSFTLQPLACAFTNGQPPVLGKVGKAFEFNGQRYITVPDNPQLNLEKANFAITFWVKTTATKTYNNVIEKRQTGGADGYAVCIYQGRPLLQLKAAGVPLNNYFGGSTTPTVNDGKWHYVAFYVERQNTVGGKIYIDGICVYTFNPTAHAGVITNKIPLYIGKHADWPYAYFEGTLDEVRIFRQ